MKHDEAYGRLPELLGLRAAERDQADLLAHAAGCPACTSRLRELERIEQLLQAGRGQAVEPPPASLERRVLAIPALDPRARPRPRRTARALAVAAGLAAAAAISLLAVRPWAAGGQPGFQREQQVTLTGPLSGTSLDASVAIGRPSGSSQPLRLIAEGLPAGATDSYALWFIGPNGNVMLRSFQPNREGSCIVDAIAPPGDWTRVVITRGSEPPTAATTVAGASL